MIDHFFDADLAPIALVINTRTGLYFDASQVQRARSAIQRRMAGRRLTSGAAYARLLETEPEALKELILELTVGETYFFREGLQLDFIRSTILPEIRARLGAEHSVRAWSAACSTGEEAYTLAWILREAGALGAGRVLGTDLNPESLRRAGEARYSAWSLRGGEAGENEARKFLDPVGDRFVVNPSLRKAVDWRQMNLATERHPMGTPGFDLILCRNVLIYFDPATIRRVAGLLYSSLADDGWLVIGPSDPLLGEFAPFDVVLDHAGVFYRKRTPTVYVSTNPLASLPPTPPAPRAPLPAHRISDPGRPPALAPLEALSAAKAAYSSGAFTRAADLLEPLGDRADASALRVQAIAKTSVERAERACSESVKRHPMDGPLHYLHSTLLLALGRDAGALVALRKVLYLDPTLAIAHHLMGSLARKNNDPAGARRGFTNARAICLALPRDTVLPLGDGALAGELADAAAAALAELSGGQP